MDILTKTELDAITGTVEVIPLTAAEIAEREKDAKDAADKLAQDEADFKAREIDKAELLAKLGITADEAKLLLG